MITDSNPIGTLSTISGNKPHSRYMSFQREGITLFTATSKQTHKVEEIQENPNVHVLLGYEDWNDPYIELQGTVTVRDGKELKEEFWHDMMLYHSGNQAVCLQADERERAGTRRDETLRIIQKSIP